MGKPMKTNAQAIAAIMKARQKLIVADRATEEWARTSGDRSARAYGRSHKNQAEADALFEAVVAYLSPTPEPQP